MSHPAAVRHPDDTAPPLRAAKGFVCATCKRRYDEFAGRTHCPEDNGVLIRATDMAAAEGDPMLGRVLAGRFTILAKLGAGSMGTVYRAKQAPIGRDVAIKILRSDRAVDEVSRARFLREARANSLLTAPNTVTVFDFGQSESGDFYLAMELLEGESLGQRIKRLARISVDEAIETVKQALRSLSEAHAKGIIHRDLKPDNLFYARVRTNETYQEIVKVLDFGIAKMLRQDGELAMNVVETQAGTVFGTPRYMSPEQAQGKPLDARSDLYSLGVILYHMLSGRPPFTDDDAIVVMARHIKTPPKSLSEVAPDARIPAEIESLVMRILSKEPEKRPESAEALIMELTRAKESAVVTSGVRASVGSGLDAPAERARGAFAPGLPGPPTSNDTLSAAAGIPSSMRRRAVMALGIGGIAVAALIGAWIVRSSRQPDSTPAALATPVPTVAPPPTTPTVVPVAVAPQPTAEAPSSTIPTLAASALPRSESPATERPGRPSRRSGSSSAAAPKPTASTPVGYGYLE